MVINYQARRKPLVTLLVFTLLLTLALYPQTASANAITETEMRSISGTVYLPEGETAPAGGISVYFFIQGEAGSANDLSDDYLDSVDWSIPEGENSVNYSISVPSNLTEGFKVSCLPFPMYGSMYEYIGGYYNSGGITQDHMSASLIAVGGVNAENIDFTLVKGIIISGTISLPGGDAAVASDIFIMVSVDDDNGTPEDFVDDKHFYQGAKISAGERSVDYGLIIPVNVSGKLIISYEKYDYENSPRSDYVHGYYNANGTVWNAGAATPLDISGGNLSRIDIVLIKGKPVTGNVSLPGGETAPAGGISVYMNLKGDNGTNDNPLDDYTTYDWYFWGIYASIPEGEKSGTYTALIPCDLAGSVKVGYTVNNSTGYISGYYGSNGTVWSASDAVPVAIDASGASDVNMTMLKGRWISGSISLPEGHVVSDGDMFINVTVMSDNWGQGNQNDVFLNGQRVQIKEGESAAAYSILVPDNPSFGFIVYSFLGSDSSYIGGCYNENGTLTNRESATRIYVAGSDIADINLVFRERTSEQNPALFMSNNLHSNVAAGTLMQAGKEIVVTVGASTIENLKGFDLLFSYDPALFELLEIKAHEDFGAESDNVYLDYVDNGGNVRIVGAILGTGDRSGDTGLVNIKLKAKTKVDGKTSAAVKAQSQIADSFEKLYTFENDIFSGIVIADPDIDGDDQIGEVDLEKAAESFMDEEGQEGYIAKRDMDKDGIVDLFDIVYVARILLHNTN